MLKTLNIDGLNIFVLLRLYTNLYFIDQMKIALFIMALSMCCGYSLEPSWCNGSLEHSERRFQLRNKNNSAYKMAFLDLCNFMFAHHVAFAKLLVFHGYGKFAVLTMTVRYTACDNIVNEN